jgi:2-amino-4-hydroxy-6-hydroxymethyldihydropteridine diphosphokinase
MNLIKNVYVIGFGSNIEPEKHVERAGQEISEIATILKKSDFIYTKPLLYTEQPDFLNGVFLIETTLNYKDLKEELNKIENRLGRVRSENKNAPRTIDLDIIVCNNKIVNKDFYERDFIQNAVKQVLPELIQ